MSSNDIRATGAGLGLSALVVSAMMVGASLLILASSVVTLSAAVVYPYAGMIALTFTAPFPRPLVIPAPGLYVALIGAILLGVILRLPVERPHLRRPAPEVLLMGAFLVYVSAHFMGKSLAGYTGSRSDDIASLYASLATGVFAFIVASVVLRGRSPYPILTALLLSSLLAAGTAIAQSLGADSLFGQLVGPSGAADRMTGPFGDPNYFGAYLAVAIALAVACAVIVQLRWLRFSLIGLVGVASVALVLSLSRGGWIALAAGLMTVALSRSLRAGMVTGGAILLAFAIAFPLFAELRYGSGSDVASQGLAAQIEGSDRVGPWLAGGEVFLSAPLFGIGWGELVEETGIAAHNWYVAVLAETGIVGFAVWVLFILSVVLALRRRPLPARTVGFSVLATWMVASMFIEVPGAYGATGPVLIALAAALWAEWPTRDGLATAPMGRVPHAGVLTARASRGARAIGVKRGLHSAPGGPRDGFDVPLGR